jgi:hypothetical protein
MGSWECISMGRGVPPGPPRVRASMNPRTTAALRAVPNSSRVYLRRTPQKKRTGGCKGTETIPQHVERQLAVFSSRPSCGGEGVGGEGGEQGIGEKGEE